MKMKNEEEKNEPFTLFCSKLHFWYNNFTLLISFDRRLLYFDFDLVPVLLIASKLLKLIKTTPPRQTGAWDTQRTH